MLEKYINGYIYQGIKIFACNPDKTPAVENGFYGATCNEDIIKKQFHNYTNKNMLIGLSTGNNNGIVVVDIDVGKPDDNRSRDEILEALKEYGELPDTYIVETPSGGFHLYFKCLFTKLSSKRRFFDSSLSVDIRANGGYVCAADGKTYIVFDDIDEKEINDLKDRCAELPQWIEDYSKTSYSSNYKDPIETILPPEEIIEIRSALAYLSSDDRDLWIKIGMCLKSTGSSSAYGLWNEWSQKSDKYNPKEMEKRWQTLKPADITIATLFHEAKKNGWVTTYNNSNLNFTFEQIEDLKKKSKKEQEKFPEELLYPEGLVGDFMDYINQRAIKKQPILALGAALTAVGALAGRKVRTETNIRTNIYCLNVGASGCGKETARRIIKKCFQDADCGHLASTEDLASDASIITSLRDNPSQIFLLDEIGRFLKTTLHAERNPYLYNIVSVLLRIYGSSDQIFYGKSYADKEKQIKISQPNLCLLGTTVPESLYKGLSIESLTNGFMSRIIIFESENKNPKKENRKNIAMKPPPKLLEQIRALHLKKINMRPCGNLDHLEPNPQIVNITEPALVALKVFDDEIHALREELILQNRADAVYNRTPQIAEQIALILAVGKNIIDPVITENDMIYAIKLMKFLSKKLLFISENYVADNDYQHNVKEILQLIRKDGYMSSKDLTKKTQNLQTYIRNDIIDTLKNSEQIYEQYEGEGNKKKKIYVAL